MTAVNTSTTVVCSTGTMPAAVGRRYHELEGAAAVACCLGIDAVEIVLHPDWRPHLQPRSLQPDPPEASEKWDQDVLMQKIHTLFVGRGISVSSVHANRDLGVFLSSGDAGEREVGRRLLHDTADVARAAGADLVVLHLWDSRNKSPLLCEGVRSLLGAVKRYPDLSFSVENIPVHRQWLSQTEVMGRLDEMLPSKVGFTLDLSWSSLYDNYDELLRFFSRIVNVHVQGRLVHRTDGLSLVARAGSMDIGRAVGKLQEMGYDGQWTLELNKVRSKAAILRALEYLGEIINAGSTTCWGDDVLS